MNDKNMTIERFEREVESKAKTLNWDKANTDIVSKVVNSAKDIVDFNGLSEDDVVKTKKLHQVNIFPKEIVEVIEDNELTLIQKIEKLNKEFDMSEFDDRKIIAALLTGKAKSSPDLYQVIIPTIDENGKKQYKSNRTPYLLKNDDDSTAIQMADRKLSDISKRSDKTLFTKSEIERNHPHLLEFLYQAETGHLKDLDWFEDTVNIIFSDAGADYTEWAISGIINDVKKKLVLEKPSLIIDSPTPLNIRVVNKIADIDNEGNVELNKNKYISLFELIAELKDNDWINDYWLEKENNMSKLLQALFSESITVADTEYQFALPESDIDGSVVCLIKPMYSNIPEYRKISIDEFNLKPKETLFTKSEIENNPQFEFLWSSRIDEDEKIW